MRQEGQRLFGVGVMTVALLIAAAPAQAKAHHHRHCTIRGTAGADRLVGTSKRDVICGVGGKDTIIGKGGGDVLSGGGGADLVIGGAGDDRLKGEPADDTLSGGIGNDTLDGGPGDDHLDGGSGKNSCNGGDGTNDLADDCDGQAPHLVAFDISPQEFDTSTGAQTVVVTAEITDNMTGNSDSSNIQFYAPRDSGAHYGGYFSPENRVSGDALDGTYRVEFTIPQYAPTGRWDANVYLFDQHGNGGLIDVAKLADWGFPGWFTQDGPGDAAAPKLQNISVSPSSVDTSAGPQNLTFTAHITDNLTGLASANVSFEKSASQDIVAHFGAWNRVSGTSTDGIYQDEETLWRYAAPGHWSLGRTTLADQIGNERGGPGVVVPDTWGFTETGFGDGTAPQIDSIELDATSINTTDAPATLTLTAHITDDFSGFNEATISYTNVTDDTLPPYMRRLVVDLDPSHRVSGTSTDGVYQVPVEFPQGSLCGKWVMTEIDLTDSLNNVAGWVWGDPFLDQFQKITNC